jgi:hypothetical protein
MAWNTLATTDITAEMLPDEVTLLNNIQGSTNILPAVLSRVTAELQSRILAGGNQIGQPGTIPDQLRGPAIAIVRWEWFCGLPKTDLQSDGRKAQYEAAQKRFDEVESGAKKVEIPADPQTISGPSNRVQIARGGRRVHTGSFDRFGET